MQLSYLSKIYKQISYVFSSDFWAPQCSITTMQSQDKKRKSKVIIVLLQCTAFILSYKCNMLC